MFCFDLIVKIKIVSIIEITRIVVIVEEIFLISSAIIRINVVLNILN